MWRKQGQGVEGLVGESMSRGDDEDAQSDGMESCDEDHLCQMQQEHKDMLIASGCSGEGKDVFDPSQSLMSLDKRTRPECPWEVCCSPNST